MHTFELDPISRVIQGSRCGIIISPPIPNESNPTGIRSNHIQPLSEASGRDKGMLASMAEIATVIDTRNFRSKNRLCNAVAISWRNLQAVKTITMETESLN